MTNMICDECETVAHCMKNGCVPKTTKKDEALKLALEALESKYIVNCGAWRVQQDQAITVIREALTSVPDWASEVIEQPSGVATIAPVAEPRKQEPIVTKNKSGLTLHVGWDDLPVGTKLYTSPAQRTWQGLTDEEIEQGQKESWVSEQAWQSAVWWAVEKLKAKNSP